jgi:hypothetical protein
MDIFDWMDCVGCPFYKHYAARLTADPYYSEPEESECSDGNYGNDHACSRMKWVINNMISDGQFETGSGYFIESECAKRIQQDDADCDVEPWFMEFDFSSAPFWWIPDNYSPCEANGEPKPYRNEQEIYDDWFA